MKKPPRHALVTPTPAGRLSTLTADCQPFLFHDSEAAFIGRHMQMARARWDGL